MEKTKEIKPYLSLQKKASTFKIFRWLQTYNKALSVFKIPKSTFYKRKKVFYADGEIGLFRKHQIAYTHPNKIKEEIVDKVLALRKNINWVLGGLNGIWSFIITFIFRNLVLPES